MRYFGEGALDPTVVSALVEPVEALQRVAYLLDRSLAPPQKAKAFLRAAEVVEELPAGELERRHADGSLRDLPGIGDSTATVIAEAMAGDVPARVRELEETTVVPLEEGADLRAALRGDCHSHSLWSDGGATIATMAGTARDLGHDYLVLTDHSPRLTIAHGLNAERLRAQLEEIAGLNEDLAPFRILTGIEVDILDDGSLDQDDDLLAELDVVVASVHSKLSMESPTMTRRMAVAVANPHVDILGHCTGRKVVGKGRPPARFAAEVVFAACARFDKAVEINCRPERQDPPEELLDLALEWGCKVSIDTDAHAPGQLEWQNYGCDKAVRAGVETAEVVNTWSADELVEWAAGHASG
ncbi:PHP domain-containing protein [soil metagenome]